LKTLDRYPDALIVFRTFGNDADDVISELRVLDPIRFATVIKGTMKYEAGVPCLYLTDQVLKGLDAINDFYGTCGPLVIKEDYNYWNQNGRDGLHGKCVKGTASLQQIFFDDNPCVNVIGDASFIRVNTLEALLDEEFYVKLIGSE
jgi:hypothetical protein